MTHGQRQKYMYNQGIRWGSIGYYKTASEGFEALKSHKPLTRLNIGDEGKFPADESAFNLGFKKVQNIRIRVMQMKAKAEEELSAQLLQVEQEKILDSNDYTELTNV